MAEQKIPALPPISSTEGSAQQGNEQVQIPNIPDIVAGPSSKDVMMGVGLLLILAIVFFFIRNSFVNYLIGPSMKRSPNNAGIAGWALFGFLFFGAAVGCVAMISKAFLTLPVIISLSGLSFVSFVITLLISLKK